jgi:hypothetical protein
LAESGKRSAAIKDKFHLRDRCIAHKVQQVLRHSRDGLKATRNANIKDGGGKESACSVVATAFGLAGGKGLGEKSINEIWRKHCKVRISGAAQGC